MKSYHNISKTLIIIVLLLTLSGMRGQMTPTAPPPELPNIIPPSPTVANLMQFEEVPVDNYTGQPDISIPLVSKSLGHGLTFDAVLKYNTQGVKIENHSGWTGTGWSLDAGGVVSRTVRGIPDEKEKGIGQEHNQTGIFHLDDYWEYETAANTVKNQFAWNVNGTNHEKFDCEMDLYQFSAPGLSGRFVVVKEGEVLVAKLLSSNQKIKIELNPNEDYSIDSFTITDANGNVLLFDKKETTHSLTTTYITPQYPDALAPESIRPETESVTAWHLSSITSSFNVPLATFTYISNTDKRKEVYESAPSETVSEFRYRQNIDLYYDENPYNHSKFKPYKVYSTNDIEVMTQKLESVLFQDGTTVNFATSAAGTHPETGGVYLTDVTYNNGIDIKHYELEYNTESARLWLMKVTESGLEYSLDYHDRDLLPGFYTGGIPSPTNDWGYMDDIVWNPTHQFGVFNPLAYEYGLLSHITYPTGGIKLFTFEPNTYQYAGSTALTNFDENPLNKEHRSSNATLRAYNNNVTIKQVTTMGETDTKPTIVLDHAQTVFVTFTHGSDPDYDLSHLTFHKVGSSVPIATVVSLSDEHIMFAVLEEAGTYEYWLDHDLALPEYDADGNPNTPNPITDEDVELHITLDYFERATDYKNYLLGGGVRIKEIVFKEEPLTLANAKKINYSYGEEIDFDQEITRNSDGHIFYGDGDNPGTSSGVFDGRSDTYKRQYYTTEDYYLYPNSGDIDIDMVSVQYSITSKGINAELSKGNYIAYRHVMVSEEGNGHTDYVYQSAYEFPTNTGTFTYPFMPSENLDYKRGLLKSSRVYNEQLHLLIETLNDYDYIFAPVAKSYVLHEHRHRLKQFYSYYSSWLNMDAEYNNKVFCGLTLCDIDYSYNTGVVSPYQLDDSPLDFGWARLISTIKKDYLYNGTETDVVTVSTAYDYNTENYQLSKQESTISASGTSHVYKTTYEYPVGGYTTTLYNSTPVDENAAISSMVVKNIVNAPLVTRSFKDNELLSTTVNKYNGNGTIKAVQTAKGAAAPEDRILYSYDSAGNPTQVSKAGGMPITYLWGYGKTLPVAMIENGSYAEIGQALGQSGPMYNTEYDEGDLVALDGIRNSPYMTNARLTTLSHIPGVGILSVTDPNGKAVTYDYDDFERLHFIADSDGNLVSVNEYHYDSESGSETGNWVKSHTLQAPLEPLLIGDLGTTAKTTSKTFLDGLGRPIQSIAHKQAGDGGDIISFMKYDALGRQPKVFLPYTRTTPSLSAESDPEASQASFYTTYTPSTSYPFNETTFEHSPLGRPTEQSAPGESWNKASGHTVKTQYQTNAAGEVKYYDCTATLGTTVTDRYDAAISNPGNYSPGELYKTIVTDENGQDIEEFKNQEGQVVLKRNHNGSETLDTYYVYDQYGNLSYVLPPAAEGAVTTTVLDGLCYQYRYDKRNRMIEKKLPGKQWEFIVYDKLDRVTATGPSFYPYTTATATTGWTITKYDVFNRVVYTAWYPSPAVGSATRKSMQDAKNAATLPSEINESRTTSGSIDSKSVHYTNTIAPTAVKLLTVSYYDNYSYPNVSAPPTTIEDEPTSTAVKGLLTGQWLKVYGIGGAMSGNVVNHYYDNKAREIGTYTGRFASGGYITVKSKLDFTGKTLYTTHQHRKATGGTVYAFTDRYSYTPEDRLAYHTHKMSIGSGGTEQLLALNSYDKLGQLIGKKVGGTNIDGSDSFQNVNYKYNIRGWMTGINDTENLTIGTDPKDLFAFKINYNAPDGSVANPLYNGNISETHWLTANDDVLRMYSYGYDGLNRLLDATFQKENDGAINDYYGEHITGSGYDKNGNIQGLERYGGVNPEDNEPIKIDDLIYGYSSTNPNQLVKVDENPTDGNAATGFKDVTNTVDYEYDANGNMVKDFNKGIGTSTTDGIIYNHLNLPMKITFANGDKIEYFYQADGVKVQKVVTQGTTVTTTDYIDGIQYTNNVLDFIPTAEGYVKNTVVNGTNTYSYVYNYTDHLGNVRLSYAKSPGNVLTILEENNYYPFGMKHSGYNNDGYSFGAVSNVLALLFNGAQSYQYRYNSKEFQDELGLNMYDYGWRNYDPAIARWVNSDPLLNDLDFAFDDSDVDEDDDEEVYEALITKLETGGGIYNTNNLNPYGYGYNNPVSFDDPDGRCPWCIAGLKGALFEYGSQVIGNLAEGKDLGDALTDVDGGEILKAGVTDALTLGVGGFINKGAKAVGLANKADKANDARKNVQKAEKALHGNSTLSKKASGNYEIKFKSGKTYNGVGDKKRMEQSAKKLSTKHKDPVASKTHKTAKDKATAYKKEHKDITKNGGAGKNNGKNYNERNSPGKKLLEKEKKK